MIDLPIFGRKIIVHNETRPLAALSVRENLYAVVY